MRYVGKDGLKVNGNEVWHEGNLEIGGRNLFKLSDILNIDAYVGATSQGTYNGNLNFTSNRTCIVVEVEEFETYSISYKEHKVGNRFSFGFYTGYEGEVSPATVGKFDWWQFPESDGKFEGYTVPQGCNYLIVYFDRIAFNINSIPVGFKVEKGNKATDWTPAPEDVQAEIDKKADKTQVLTNVPANAKFTDTVTTINGKTGAIAKADIVALGIPAQDTVYTHPATHPASMITESSTKRFVSDTEKSTWNGKAEISDIPTKVGQLQNDKNYVTQSELGEAGLGDMLKSIYDINDNGIVDNAEKVNGFTVGVNVPANAKFTDTVYTHPANHPASMITESSTKRFVSDAEKTAWNGKQNALGYTPVNKAGDTVTGELHLQNTSVRDYLKLERTGRNAARFWFSLGYGHFSIDSDSGQYLFSVKSNGNVGVGTGNSSTGPTQKLDVDGKIRMRTQTQATDADDTVATKKYVDDKVASGGIQIAVGTSEPSGLQVGDWWYKEI